MLGERLIRSAPLCLFPTSCVWNSFQLVLSLLFKYTKARTFRLLTGIQGYSTSLPGSAFFPFPSSRTSCYLWPPGPMLATLVHPFSQWHHTLGRKCYPFYWLWASLKQLPPLAQQVEESKTCILTTKMGPNNRCLVPTSQIKLKRN